MFKFVCLLLLAVVYTQAINNNNNQFKKNSNLIPRFGNVHPSCITRVNDASFEIKHADGDRLVITTSDGVETIVEPCNVTLTHGSAWKAWAEYNSKSATSTSVSGEWVVPANPTATAGQTLFYWNGIEPQDNSAVLQPVLQYGVSAAGGGAYWSFASWYVSATRTVVSSLQPVAVGDTILGYVIPTNSVGKQYVVNATSQQHWKSAQIIYTPNVAFTYTYGAVLEAYGISDCKQYTSTGKVDFTEIIVDVNGAPVTPKWSPKTQLPTTCKEHAVVVDATHITIFD